MRYPIAIEPGNETTAWGVVVPDLPGSFSAGDTMEEAMTQAEEAIAAWIGAAIDDGQDIPPHSTRPDIAAPAITWTPMIAPGDMIFYSGKAFRDWQGQVLVAGLGPKALLRLKIEGDKAVEVARYPMDRRIRDVAEAADGALLVIEDREGGRLLKLTPNK